MKVYVVGEQEDVMGVYASKEVMEKDLGNGVDKIVHDPIFDEYVTYLTYDGEQEIHHYWYEECEVIE